MRFAARTLGLVVAAVAIAAAPTIVLGRLGALPGVAVAIVFLLCVQLWLPRMAHGQFARGRFSPALRRYRVLRLVATSELRERAALLSIAGCHVALGDPARAERLLAQLDATTLAAAERAVTLNNRACALLATDPHRALALVDEAAALRPDVPALQHTRASALLGVGRVDDAIQVLDAMRTAGELSPRLEAERCRELARAWAQKGQPAYAEDYRLRADVLGR